MQQMLLLAKRLNTNDVILDYVEHKFSLRELSVNMAKADIHIRDLVAPPLP